jgi:hypothetical protein
MGRLFLSRKAHRSSAVPPCDRRDRTRGHPGLLRVACASGAHFHDRPPTVAHRCLPFGTRLRIARPLCCRNRQQSDALCRDERDRQKAAAQGGQKSIQN